MNFDKKFSVFIVLFFLIGLSLGFILSQNFYSPTIETSVQLPDSQETLDLSNIESLLKDLINKEEGSNNSTTLSIDLSNIESLLQELVNKDEGSVSLNTSGIEAQLNQINTSLQSNSNSGGQTDLTGIESQLNNINNSLKSLESRLRYVAYYACLDADYDANGYGTASRAIINILTLECSY